MDECYIDKDTFNRMTEALEQEAKLMQQYAQDPSASHLSLEYNPRWTNKV